ncbi:MULTISPECIES: hypothetical protein [unclassified Phaeobacter]|uniref:hypothetical protein n=1 Tax=unclassified Phaeobacter TaxID=2621772 RepID=UPI003A8429E7
MKNFYEIDRQLTEIEDEFKNLQSKSEGVVWVKYVAIAVGMGVGGALILIIPMGLILGVLDWLVGLFGGSLSKGPGTLARFILGMLTWVGFLAGFACAVWLGIIGGMGVNERMSQLHRTREELRERRFDYLRSSTD